MRGACVLFSALLSVAVHDAAAGALAYAMHLDKLHAQEKYHRVWHSKQGELSGSLAVSLPNRMASGQWAALGAGHCTQNRGAHCTSYLHHR